MFKPFWNGQGSFVWKWSMLLFWFDKSVLLLRTYDHSKPLILSPLPSTCNQCQVHTVCSTNGQNMCKWTITVCEKNFKYYRESSFWCPLA